MKFIQNIKYAGDATEAIELYRRAFGCTVRSLIYYADAVKNGWEEPNPELDKWVYHSEIMFGEQEVRMFDTFDAGELETQRRTDYSVGFRTEEEVRKVFEALSQGGEVIRPLEKPPYMVIIGTVRDRFGISWTLMCDFNY